jgi:hypothetical protein
MTEGARAAHWTFKVRSDGVNEQDVHELDSTRRRQAEGIAGARPRAPLTTAVALDG